MLKAIIFDLDGTIYRGSETVPGAPEVVSQLQKKGCRTIFVTNRANLTPQEIASKLKGHGISCAVEDILTSSQATVQYLGKGSYFYVGEEGLRQVITEAGYPISDHKPDFVVVGLDRFITYQKIEKAAQLIRAGAKFVATNADKTVNTDNGISPGNGAIVAAIAVAAGKDALVIGKPERLIIDMALKKGGCTAKDAILVGDYLDTDIQAGLNAGVRSALILTGISSRADLAQSSVKPTWVVEDFEGLKQLLATL